MDNIIEVKGLVKRFGGRTAVNGLSMSIRSGEVFGFPGPNGAGKTTTVRILSAPPDFSEGSVAAGGIGREAQFGSKGKESNLNSKLQRMCWHC